MVGNNRTDTISDMVNKAFAGIKSGRVDIIQSYISIVVQRVERLESTALRAAVAIVVSFVIFFFITNNYLSDIEIGGVKIDKLQVLIPFYPAYLGYLIYVLCSSFVNALTLELIAKVCYGKIAPGMKANPLSTIFMIRSIIGSENHELSSSTSRLEKYSKTTILLIIIAFISICTAAALIHVCYISLSSAVLAPIYAWSLALFGILLTVRAYIYFVVNVSID